VEVPSFTGTNVLESSIYNALGQLQKQTTMAGPTRLVADKLFEYDEVGNPFRSGLDVDGDGALLLVSTDRLNETATVYEKNGADWFRVTTNRTYLMDNNSTPTVEVQRERLTGFPLNGTEQTIAETVVTNIAGNSTTTTRTADRAAKKQVTTVNTPDSNVNGVSITINGLLRSSAPTTPELATTYAYDSLGRLISVSNPRAGTSTHTYSSTSGQLTSTNDGAGTTQYDYYPVTHTNAGKLKTQTNSAGKKTYFKYNGHGQVVQTWGEATYPLEYVYDSYGQRTELHTFRAGQNWTANAWPTTTGTADVTKWIYHEATGLVVQKQDAALKGPIYSYDDLGRVKTRLWARGITSTYGYDASTGELRTVTHSESTPGVTFTYDRGGRPASVSDAGGIRQRTFTVAGQLATEQITGGLLNGVGLTVGYDSFLRRNSLQTSHGSNTLSSQAYGYDMTSRLQTVTSGTRTATYSYYPDNGLLNTTAFTGGTNTARTYDSIGRLQTMTNAPAADAAQIFTYSYNNLNQRTRSTGEDGSYWSYTYNDRGEVVSGKKYWFDNSIVWGAQAEYNFDNFGNRIAIKDGGDQLGTLRQSNYTAGPLNQYSQRTVPAAVDVTGTANSAATVTVNDQNTARKGDFFYKELGVDNSTASVYSQIKVVGARSNVGVGGEDAVTEKGGRAFSPSATEAFNYDFDGNLTSDGRWSFTWDAENRLTRMEAIPSVPVDARSKLEFAYDFLGRRIEKKVYLWNAQASSYQLQSTARFVYDEWNLLTELDENSAVDRSYVWGLDVGGTLSGAGGIGALLFVNEDGLTYHAGYDGNGNVTFLTNAASGAITGSYEYDAFGNTMKLSGQSAASNPFRFSTKFTDTESGLIYYGYRYYNPQTGRWLNRDPKGELGGPNLYSFLANNSLTRVDPWGMESRDYWQEQARSVVGFRQGMNALSLNGRITAAYAAMYKRNPRVYVWSGAAAFASDLAGQGMRRAIAMTHESGNPLVALSLMITGAPTGAELLNFLARGNLYIYADIYWQHLAFDAKGIDEMKSLNQQRELPDDLYRAWCFIHIGKKQNSPGLIWKGNGMLAEYEQRVTIKRVYDHHSRAIKWLSDRGNLEDYGFPIFESPIPGDPVTFYQFNPNGNLANTEDRWRWISESALPAWKQLTEQNPDQVMVLINRLIAKGWQ
jgi:RHS repeat-associated protein